MSTDTIFSGFCTKIAAAFPKGTIFGGARQDERPSISSVIEDGDKIIVPVTVSWRATRVS